MYHDWDNADEDAYTGHDVYLEGEEEELDLEDHLMQDDPDVTEEQHAAGDDDGIHAQRQSIQEILDSFISVVPATQTLQTTSDGPAARLTSTLTMEQVRLLLAAARSRGLPASFSYMGADDDEDDPDYVPDDNDDEGGQGISSIFPLGFQRPQPKNWFKAVTEPQAAGVGLMNSGDFGRLRAKKKRNMRKILREREMGVGRRGKGMYKEDFSRLQIPNSNGTIVATYGSNAYCGQYSADSSFYYSCCQDWRLHIYDTKAPFGPSSDRRGHDRASTRRQRVDGSVDHETTMKSIKTVNAVPGSWTITDSHLSPDNERLIYSSITDTVYMTKTFEPSAPQIPLRFGNYGRSRSSFDYDSSYFGIYSCRFSADGNEVIAGGNGQHGELRVYDLLANRKTITIDAHADDVNSCCWADTTSGNVLISASDDTFLKVWDRRSLSSSQKPSGVLVGHTEGITYVSAKGDGRYVISNGKDQSMKLWDLRKMRSHEDFETYEHKYYGQSSFDYRHGYYARPKYEAHPNDCSVMTYRGHQVFRTLIRCRFSPAETTGCNYLYTGSSDGRIHIYSLDGRIVQVLDRRQTLPMSFDPSEPDPGAPIEGRHTAPVCVRDVSWHSQEPVLMSVGWENGRGGYSSVARHEWKGIGKLGDGMGKLEDHVERQKLERAERARQRTARRERTGLRMPGSFGLEDEE